MKPAFILLFIFFSLVSFARQPDTSKKKPGPVTFIAVINAKDTQKDGIQLNGYVVNLDYDQIQKLHRKKIRVTGEVILVEGIPKDSEGEVQGREGDSWHIPSPIIEIINTKTVIFTTIVDSARETKDGIYMKGYVVNISREQIHQLHGKEIRITGKVSIEEGLSKSPSGPIRQGRQNDTRHIENPKIEIL